MIDFGLNFGGKWVDEAVGAQTNVTAVLAWS